MGNFWHCLVLYFRCVCFRNVVSRCTLILKIQDRWKGRCLQLEPGYNSVHSQTNTNTLIMTSILNVFAAVRSSAICITLYFRSQDVIEDHLLPQVLNTSRERERAVDKIERLLKSFYNKEIEIKYQGQLAIYSERIFQVYRLLKTIDVVYYMYI